MKRLSFAVTIILLGVLYVLCLEAAYRLGRRSVLYNGVPCTPQSKIHAAPLLPVVQPPPYNAAPLLEVQQP